MSALYAGLHFLIWVSTLVTTAPWAAAVLLVAVLVFLARATLG